MTGIPWTEVTINPWVGCTKIAAGCKNCYAERMARRLRGIGNKAYADVIGSHGSWTGRIGYQMEQLDKLQRMRKPRMVFMCSMTDPFHEDVSFESIAEIIKAAIKYPQHTIQLLTKRIERAAKFCSESVLPVWTGMNTLPENLWLGTSISTQADADKMIPILLQIPAAVRFVSLEPLLERIDLSPYLVSCDGFVCPNEEGPIHVDDGGIGIDWVIIGCESGPKARLCTLADIRYVLDQTRASKTPTFLKQIPINGKCRKDPKEWPIDLQGIQEYPK